MSVNGLTFKQIANSSLTSRASKANGYSMPKSPQTIRDHFVKEFKTTLMTVSKKVNAAKKNGDCFSISFDESTSVRNRRSMNFNLHDRQSFQSLGMIRVKGNKKSEKAIELIQGRLAKFNLNLDPDIVATIMDGASVIIKVGRETSPCTLRVYRTQFIYAFVTYCTKRSEKLANLTTKIIMPMIMRLRKTTVM